jgi:hypothetical protein
MFAAQLTDMETARRVFRTRRSTVSAWCVGDFEPELTAKLLLAGRIRSARHYGPGLGGEEDPWMTASTRSTSVKCRFGVAR